MTALAAWSVAAAAEAATVSRSAFGETKAGDQVEAFTLTNSHGMSARILSLGGAIDQINVPDRQGRKANVVLSLQGAQGYDAAGSFNTIVGRFANRIAGGGFTLDGVRYPLQSAPNGVSIHGGRRSFGSKIWKGETFQNAQGAGVRLTYVSPDMENGFPGTLTTTVTYTLTETNALRIDYEATADKPTVVNLTNHTYFNLAGHGDVYDQVIEVRSSRYTPADKDQVPTGEIVPVDGTPLDLRKPTRIGDGVASSHPQMLIARGFDHNLILDKPAGDPLPLAVRAWDPASGRVMEVRTTEPAVQFYTGNNLNGGQIGADGQTLRQSYGFALETEHFPDSPNKPQFPTTVLRPGQTFHSTTQFQFSVLPPARR